MNWQVHFKPLSRQTPGSDQQELFNSEETTKLAKWPKTGLRNWQAATGTLQTVLRRVSLNGSIITI